MKKLLSTEEYSKTEIEAIKRINRSEPLLNKLTSTNKNKKKITLIENIEENYNNNLSSSSSLSSYSSSSSSLSQIRSNINLLNIKPIFHHPLPLSRHRFQHEKQLREVSTHHINRQALTAVTLQNAWVLEEVLMRGAPVDIPDKNGYTPLHISCSLNDFECTMVLINFGANVNATTIAGVTPLFIAEAAGSTQVIELLIRENAIRKIGSHRNLPGATVLEANPVKHNSVLNAKGDCVGMPHEHTWF